MSNVVSKNLPKEFEFPFSFLGASITYVKLILSSTNILQTGYQGDFSNKVSEQGLNV